MFISPQQIVNTALNLQVCCMNQVIPTGTQIFVQLQKKEQVRNKYFL